MHGRAGRGGRRVPNLSQGGLERDLPACHSGPMLLPLFQFFEAPVLLSEYRVRARVAKYSQAVQKAAFDIWSAAKVRCEHRKYGYFIGGFHASVGVGGQFDLNSSTETQTIGSALLFDPVNLDNRKVGLSSRGFVGQIGIGFDWNKPGHFSGFRRPGVSPDGFEKRTPARNDNVTQALLRYANLGRRAWRENGSAFSRAAGTSPASTQSSDCDLSRQ